MARSLTHTRRITLTPIQARNQYHAAEDAGRLARFGCTWPVIAARLGYNGPKTLARALRRAGDPGPASACERAAQATSEGSAA